MTDTPTEPGGTAPVESTKPGGGSKKPDPAGVEGANPALDDTGHIKARETGEAPEPPENPEDLDLTAPDAPPE
ncbi:hypothetical protein [Arthrobacter sp. ISL-72]|uniref:hypothetical protein n=1 Tax=Arthrobacter sp. ISL-72 TaxID=2819114 RepID=UPI001BE84420|nr:hypothetical protein [Arthrobacter sp. ISL-72]MBT2596583.1 hypothetical protein [Arthrobacter sp. ISL-72]